MADDPKGSKAKKLAAARKKLKEYQNRGTDGTGLGYSELAASHAAMGMREGYKYPSAATLSISSNVSEKSDYELNFNYNDAKETGSTTPTKLSDDPGDALLASSSSIEPVETTNEINYFADRRSAASPKPAADALSSVNSNADSAIKMLVEENAQLRKQLDSQRVGQTERDMQIEELREQLHGKAKYIEELQQKASSQQNQIYQLRDANTELQQQFLKATENTNDHAAEMTELQLQYNCVKERNIELEKAFRDKCNEAEMALLRISQLSDESNSVNDNRVERLSQTQQMHEQQIKDLQAMVHHLTQEKEQAGVQYQTYVQHLNAEVSSLKDKNSELSDEVATLQERERQLIDHISSLEREIQKNLSRRAETKQETPELLLEIKNLKEIVSDFDAERSELQLKIKTQQDQLHTANFEVERLQQELDSARDYMEKVTNEQPDTVKLLATMESDKVAASRALQQNVELKKQLDELELRFVQLTNDKADLMNQLDAEEYRNREMRTEYNDIEERLRTFNERFKYKDEEMIRLASENMQLLKDNEVLRQRMSYANQFNSKTRRSHHLHEPNNKNPEHHEHHVEHDNCDHDHEHGSDVKHEHHDHHHDDHEPHDHHHDDHEHDGHHHDDHEHDGHHHDGHEQDHGHTDNSDEYGQEATELDALSVSNNELQSDEVDYRKQYSPRRDSAHSSTPQLATQEAVEKLQKRFTQLMGQVADLTEEKQRLEHLVMQLQGETETIGEYIALYQTQRRMLKQREYEKAAQMQLLQAERSQMREKIALLNNLVSSLGGSVEQTDTRTYEQNSVAESFSIEPKTGDSTPERRHSAGTHHRPALSSGADTDLNHKLNSAEPQKILEKIQTIITEMKENNKDVPTVTHTVDHLNCCLGKFEVV